MLLALNSLRLRAILCEDDASVGLVLRFSVKKTILFCHIVYRIGILHYLCIGNAIYDIAGTKVFLLIKPKTLRQ